MNQQEFKKWQVREGLTIYNARAQSLSTTDILAHIIRDRDIAVYILDNIEFDDLENISIPEMTAICNCNNKIAEQIVSAIELGRRVSITPKFNDNVSLENPAKTWVHVKDKFTDITGKEELIVIYLDVKLKPIKTEIMFRGTIRATVYSAREILKGALKYNAESIILCHNHPGGTLEPSSEDKKLTVALRDGCGYLDVRFIDHIIITKQGYYSIADNEVEPNENQTIRRTA